MANLNGKRQCDIIKTLKHFELDFQETSTKRCHITFSQYYNDIGRTNINRLVQNVKDVNAGIYQVLEGSYCTKGSSYIPPGTFNDVNIIYLHKELEYCAIAIHSHLWQNTLFDEFKARQGVALSAVSHGIKGFGLLSFYLDATSFYTFLPS